MTNETHAIRDLLAAWAEAMKAQDIARLLTLVTEDIVFLPPNHPPVRGKQAVRVMFESFFPQFASVEQTTTQEEIEISGDLAFIWGSESLVLAPKSGGAPVRLAGHGMSILRRENGAWKFASGINNSAVRAG
jgi:uncharacterized protein (TIGR02246 family)